MVVVLVVFILLVGLELWLDCGCCCEVVWGLGVNVFMFEWFELVFVLWCVGGIVELLFV